MTSEVVKFYSVWSFGATPCQYRLIPIRPLAEALINHFASRNNLVSQRLEKLYRQLDDSAERTDTKFEQIRNIVRTDDAKAFDTGPVKDAALALSNQVLHICDEAWGRIRSVPKGKERAPGPANKDAMPKDDSSASMYVELNAAERTVTFGCTSCKVTSEQAWDLLKTLISNNGQDRITPRDDDGRDRKNAVDTLRRQIGKDNLRLLIQTSRHGYYLQPSVQIRYSSQRRIKRTKQ